MASNPFRDAAGAGAASGFNPWVMGGAAALSALNGLFGDDASEDLQSRAIGLQERAYGDRAPFRAMSLARLEQPMPTRPDMTADFADESNPFYRAPQPLSFGKTYQPPGASRPETALKAKGLSSLVEGPSGGPTRPSQMPEEVWDELPPVRRGVFSMLGDDSLTVKPSARAEASRRIEDPRLRKALGLR